jgi:hypothetical protein
MSDDLTNAPSNGAGDETAIAETNVAETQELPIAKSSGEAIDRAFERVSEEPKTVQNRKPDGKFAKGKTEVKEETAEYQAASTEPTPNIAQAAFDINEIANFGLTKEALEAATKADPKLLADMKRRFTELTQGIEKHKPAAESWAKGQKYVEMARNAGKDIWDVVDQYVQMETVLRNPQTRAQGLFALAQNLGVDPMQLAQEIASAAQGHPYQPAQPQQQYLTPEQARELARQEAEAFYAERNAYEQIEKFKADHPRFEELQDDIAGMLAHPRIAALPASEKLKAAYEAADRLNPAAPAVATPAATQTPAVAPTPQAVQPATPDPKTKAKANLSITGSPDGGSNPATRKIPGSTGEALDAAFARVGL